mgnify:CR=1 FL=1
MNRLRKLVESSEYGERTGRVAYLLRPETLPKPQEGFAWVEDTGFNAADAVLGDPSLKDAFKAAIAEGCAVVAARGAAKPAAQTAPANYNGRVYTVEIDGKGVSKFDAAAVNLPQRKSWSEPIREIKRPAHGYIGLQNHDPGDVVWFKEVAVRGPRRKKQ